MSAEAQPQPPRPGPERSVQVAIVADGPWARNTAVATIVTGEILNLTAGEFDVSFPQAHLYIADWSVSGVRGAADAALAAPDVDLILAMGVLASQEFGLRQNLAKPVIAPFIFDADMQGLPSNADGTSGRRNLVYFATASNFTRDLVAFREITPFTRAVILTNASYIDAIPGLPDRLRQLAGEQSVSLTVIPMGQDPATSLAAIPSDTEAVLVAPQLHLSAEATAALVAELKARKLPSLSLLGRTDVERGIMVTIRPQSDFTRIARRIALYVQRILLGEDAGTLPLAFPTGETLVINMETVRAIGLSPSWALLTEAELVGVERTQIERKLDLLSAIEEALARNRDLAVAALDVDAGAHRIKGARANLLPQVEVGSSARVIDTPSAEASLGSAPKFLWDAEATATQVIWSDGAWANYHIEGHLQRSREEDLARQRLDVALDAGVAYLNVLRAKTLERIQRQNLSVTRANLDLARTRTRIGTGNPAEVYRWESQIANDRKAVIEAAAQRNVAEIALNRILFRPSEEPFETAEVALAQGQPPDDEAALFAYFADPGSFRFLRQRLVARAVDSAPELAQLRAAMDAQERLITANRRSYFSPTLAAQGGLTANILREGAGTEGLDLSPFVPPDQMVPPLPEAPRVSWFVGLSLSLPLYQGGARAAELASSRVELNRYRRQYESIEEQLKQRMASSLHIAGASYAGIQLSRDAAEAARKNLDIITYAYGKGTVSIIDLIDAQNAARVADQLAADAVYGFLADWLNVQRASGSLELLQSVEERQALLRDLQQARATTGSGASTAETTDPATAENDNEIEQ